MNTISGVLPAGHPESYYTTCPPDWSAGVVHVGREACVPGHSFQGVRDHYLLHFVSAGRGSVRTGRRRVGLVRGDAFVYRPGDYLDYIADLEDPWVYTWVGFRGIHADDLLAPLGLRAESPVVEMPYAERVERVLITMLEALRDRSPGAPLRVTGLLYELFAAMADTRRLAKVVRTSAADLVSEAKMFIQQNFQREIDVADVVRYIGVDRSHFSRVFRACEGVSLRNYLIATRMERAMRLLRETDLPVRAVASSVGYATYAAFERRFRAHYRLAPSAARREAIG